MDIDTGDCKLILYLAPLLEMEGDEIVVSLLPYQQSLLMRIARYILSNPSPFILDYDPNDDMMSEQILDMLDDITYRLSVD